MIDGTYKIEVGVPFGRKTGTVVLRTQGDTAVADIDAPIVGKQHVEGRAEGDTFTAQGSGKIPLVIGITGHLELREKDRDMLRETVKRELEKLRGRCPYTPVVMLMKKNVPKKKEFRAGQLPQFCQSCGMPLSSEDMCGTDADGSINYEYCKYCYSQGRFLQDFTMEEMAEHCSQFVDEVNKNIPQPLTREQYKQMMLGFFPMLKRWRRIG